MHTRGTFNEQPAARMFFCLAEPFFEPAPQLKATCLYTIFSVRTPIRQAVGEKTIQDFKKPIEKVQAKLSQDSIYTPK